MGFALFLMMNAILFIRPTEIIPDLEFLRPYEVVTLICGVVAAGAVLSQFSGRTLVKRPITICLIGLLAAVMISHLARLSLWGARMGAYDFIKVVVYYLLLVATVNTASRLRFFLIWLTALIGIVALLALLQYHGVIDLPSLAALNQPDFDPETGELVTIPRLRGTGIFNDPNDLSLMMVMGIYLCLYWLGCREMGALRVLWSGLLIVFLYALMLTHSRGGLLALAGGLLVLFQARYGLTKAVALGVLVLPLMLVLFGGRQTRFDISDRNDTAQERLQIWAEGLGFLRREPLFGIGYNQFAEECSYGLVAHNSYVHSYAELGFLGGTLFVGVFYTAYLTLRGLGKKDPEECGQESDRLRPVLMAMLTGYLIGMFSLSRCYVIPTYLVPGLVTAYLQVTPRGTITPLRWNGRLAGRLAVASTACVAALYLFVRSFVQFG